MDGVRWHRRPLFEHVECSPTALPTCSPAELKIEDCAKMTDSKMDLGGARLSPLTCAAETCHVRAVAVLCRRLTAGQPVRCSILPRQRPSEPLFPGVRATLFSTRAAGKPLLPRAQRAPYCVACLLSGATILLHFGRVWRRALCCAQCWRRASRAACAGHSPTRCAASGGAWEAADGRTRDGPGFHKPQGRPIGLSSRLVGFLGTGKRFRLGRNLVG